MKILIALLLTSVTVLMVTKYTANYVLHEEPVYKREEPYPEPSIIPASPSGQPLK